ncbi:hypothetical protein J7M22_10560 [Candidatus Poribacteria bacterium]|nr:hypothetical protein [Candidatus Poribacteria bacterium]
MKFRLISLLCLLSFTFWLAPFTMADTQNSLNSGHRASDSVPLISLDLSDSEIYNFIERLSVRGLLDFHTNTIPIRTDEALAILNRIRERAENGRISLSPAEIGKLKRLIKSIPAFRGKGERFGFDPSGGIEVGDDGSGGYLSIYSKPAIFGAIGDRISFMTGFKYGMLKDHQNYPPLPGERIYSTGDLWQVSSIRAYLNVRITPSLSLLIGRDRMWWGPGRFGSLVLSYNSGPKDMIALNLRTRRIDFVSFTSILKSGRGNKRLSGHRLEVLPFGWMRIGIHELILYSDRFEIGYLNPVTIYFVSEPMTEYGNRSGAENKGGSVDNLIIGGDLSIRPLKGVEIYGEVLVDDFQPQKGLEGFKDWDSKYGILMGGYLVDPFGLRDMEVRVEYAFINQWCYTHESGLLAYTDMERVMGHPMGNDADSLGLELKGDFSSHIRGSLRYLLTREGETDVNDIHPKGGSEEWEFLSGTEEIRHDLSLNIGYNPPKLNWRIDLMTGIYHVRNLSHRKGRDDNGLRFALKLERSSWRGVN